MESREPFKEQILSDLPTNTDEPADLRESIAEELGDHLQCAMRRELLNEPDQTIAKERVMQRFGSVNGVARQLWFDAMRQRLMTQKLLVIAALLLAIGCASIGWVAWTTVSRLQNAVREEVQVREAAAKKLVLAEAQNQRLIEQLAVYRVQQDQPEEDEPADDEPAIPNGNMELTDGDKLRDWENGVADRDDPYEGKVSGRITLDKSVDINVGMKLVNQQIDATPYRGKRIRFSCAVRVDANKKSWLRLMLGTGQVYDSGPIQNKQWTRADVSMDVPDDAEHLKLGLGFAGEGTAWFDAAKLEVMDSTEPLPQKIRNGNMETVIDGRVAGTGAVADPVNPYEGKYSARITNENPKAQAGSRYISATPYRGKRIRYRAAVRVESESDGKAALWCRVNRKEGGATSPIAAFDNMQDRPITSSEWQHYEIVLDVPEDASSINAGSITFGPCTTWIDDVTLEIVDKDQFKSTDQLGRREEVERVVRESGTAPAPKLLSQISNGDMETVVRNRTAGWNAIADQTNPFEGEVSARMQSDDTKPVAGLTSNSTQPLDATPYRGKRIRYRAAVRVESDADGRAQMWCRVDRKAGSSGEPKLGAFDNMQDRPITDSKWERYEIVLDVAEDAETVLAGIFTIGHKTTVWFDDVSLKVVEGDVETTSLSSPDLAPKQPFFNNWLWLVVITLGLMLLSQRTKRDENGLNVDPGFAAKFALRFTVAYWLLYSLPEPFTNVLPGLESFSAWYTSSVDKLVRWVAADMLGIQRGLIAPNGSGDTTFAYVRLLIGFVLSIGVAILWSAVDWRKTNYSWTRDLLRSYLRYVLAFTMLGYGLAKAGFAMSQFPEPGSFQLDRTYGDSSPMGLLWTFMGASRSYTIFSGLAECLCAILLVWRRTTTLGSIATFSVMLNVVMLNFSYDVPVKQYSVHLLVMAIYIALPDLKRLLGVLLLNRATKPVDDRPPYAPGKLVWLARLVKVTVIAVGVGIPVYAKVKAEVEHAKFVAADPEFMGKFEVESEDGDAIFTSITFFTRPYSPEGKPRRTMYLRANGRAGAREMPCTWDGETIRVTGEPGPFAVEEFTVKTIDGGRFEMSVIEPKPATYILRESRDVPLLSSRGFRWINEVPFNR